MNIHGAWAAKTTWTMMETDIPVQGSEEEAKNTGQKLNPGGQWKDRHGNGGFSEGPEKLDSRKLKDRGTG